MVHYPDYQRVRKRTCNGESRRVAPAVAAMPHPANGSNGLGVALEFPNPLPLEMLIIRSTSML
jgi:hypothetical protein